jgi:hypothetical protein
MRVAKLNPTTKAWSGGTIPVAKINFPGFQEIADFTSTGSEAAFSVPVDGDTDKEYIILTSNSTAGGAQVQTRLNNDGGTNYGDQRLTNLTGTIGATRATNREAMFYDSALSFNVHHLLTPAGFIKTGFWYGQLYTSGTTVGRWDCIGQSWNNTANVTSLNFVASTGNFSSGTRITVYARRSN